MSTLPAEFSLIARHFRPLAGPGGLDLADDAAVFTPPPGRELVVAADAMVAGVHFLPDDPPALIGRKLLRVNLSDLAAMGAEPLGYLMTISAPRGTDDTWFAAFAAGLAADQTEFSILLLGGDTTHTPGPLCLSLTVLGTVAPGRAVRRSGAQPGDGIFVTGTIGDGALGLLSAKGEIDDPSGFLADRYRLPQPRLGVPVAHIRAAMDISDGLVQDLEHLCRAAGLGAELDATLVPLSPPARAAGRLATCLTGGDDYELLMAVDPAQADLLARTSRVPVTRIGTFVPGDRVVVHGCDLAGIRTGWSHF